MARRVMQGRVLRDAKDKTVPVLVERRVKHPLYKKYIRRSKKFLAHDEQNTSREGDIVRIIEARPISKRKRFVVVAEATQEN